MQASNSTYLDAGIPLKFTLLVLHPFSRLAPFEDTTKWDPTIAVRAKQLLEEEYALYAARYPSLVAPATKIGAKGGSDGQGVLAAAIGAPARPEESEIVRYLKGTYPCFEEDGALTWWKVCLSHSAPIPPF